MNIKSENVSIGVDIEEVSRFDKYAQNKADAMIKRIFTESEIEYCFSSNNPAQHLCVRYSAKEALYKAFCSFGIKISNLSKFEILKDNFGVPFVKLPNEYSDEFDVKISLSHSKTNAIAQVLVFRKDC